MFRHLMLKQFNFPLVKWALVATFVLSALVNASASDDPRILPKAKAFLKPQTGEKVVEIYFHTGSTFGTYYGYYLFLKLSEAAFSGQASQTKVPVIAMAATSDEDIPNGDLKVITGEISVQLDPASNGATLAIPNFINVLWNWQTGTASGKRFFKGDWQNLPSSLTVKFVDLR